MAQVNLDLDEDTARKLKAVAKASGLSQSKWVAKVIRERVSDQWPPELAALAGTWPDFPEPRICGRDRGNSGREGAGLP